VPRRGAGHDDVLYAVDEDGLGCVSTCDGEEEGEYHDDEAEHVARGEESPRAGQRDGGHGGRSQPA
jgi:hypothetical protein